MIFEEMKEALNKPILKGTQAEKHFQMQCLKETAERIGHKLSPAKTELMAEKLELIEKTFMAQLELLFSPVDEKSVVVFNEWACRLIKLNSSIFLSRGRARQKKENTNGSQ